VSSSLLEMLLRGEYPPIHRARISHALFGRGMQLLSSSEAEELCQRVQLPPAWELLDNLLLWMAEETGSPGETISFQARNWRARLGALSTRGVEWAIDEALRGKLLVGRAAGSMNSEDVEVTDATLTSAGWRRVAELQRDAKDSKKAFMAMKLATPKLTAYSAKNSCRRSPRPASICVAWTMNPKPDSSMIACALRFELVASCWQS